MTLNLFIAAPWGMWLSTDFRVSELRHDGHAIPRVDHWSPKYMMVVTGQEARVAWTYTGVAEVTAVQPDLGDPEQSVRPGTRRRVDVSEWLSWILYGHATNADEVVERIRSQATKVPEFRRFHHLFSGALIGPKPLMDTWFLQIANVDRRPGEGDNDPSWITRPPLKEFHFNVRRVDDPPMVGWGALGSGGFKVSRQSRELIKRAKDHKPRNPRDFMNILAKINGQVAADDPGVSPACHVVFMYRDPPNGAPGFVQEMYANGQALPAGFQPGLRMNVNGVDLLDHSRRWISRYEAERDSSHRVGENSIGRARELATRRGASGARRPTA